MSTEDKKIGGPDELTSVTELVLDVNRGQKVGGPGELTSVTELVSDVNRGQKKGGPDELTSITKLVSDGELTSVAELVSDVNRGQQKGGPVELTSVIELVSDVAAGRGVQGGLSGQQDTRQGDWHLVHVHHDLMLLLLTSFCDTTHTHISNTDDGGDSGVVVGRFTRT